MGIKVFLYSDVYPEREKSLKRTGIDVTEYIHFTTVQTPAKEKKLPFLGIYQSIVDAYFSYKKWLKPRHHFVLITGGGIGGWWPKTVKTNTLVYFYSMDCGFPIANQQRHSNNNIKELYYKPWHFISNALDTSPAFGPLNFLKRATIISVSNYTKNSIKAYDVESTVIYPPCPQYTFPLGSEEIKADTVCSLGRFVPRKEYETILEAAARLPDVHFDLVGSVTPDYAWYLQRLKNAASKNVRFHVNATVEEKTAVLRNSKVLLHSFVGEHFGIALVEAMSAGVIPVTHNSGAAKVDGLVPDNFRYNNLDEAVACVTKALSAWKTEKALQLREFSKSFSPEAFRQNLKIFISNWLRSGDLTPRQKEQSSTYSEL